MVVLTIPVLVFLLLAPVPAYKVVGHRGLKGTYLSKHKICGRGWGELSWVTEAREKALGRCWSKHSG